MEAIFNSIDINDIKLPTSGERAITNDQWDIYQNKITDRRIRNLIKTVRKETIYVSWDMFKSYLMGAFQQFAQKIGDQPFKVFLPLHKFGSEYIFTALLWDSLKKLNMSSIITTDDTINDHDHILFIDDAIYSGTYVTCISNRLLGQNRKINLHIVVACSSHITKRFRRVFNQSVSIYATKYIPWIQIGACSPFYMYNKELVPLYFDHKVASACSSFYLIYMKGITANESFSGMLLPLSPDTSLKTLIYEKYFKDSSVPPPHEMTLEHLKHHGVSIVNQ